MQNNYTEKSDFYFTHIRHDILNEIESFFSPTDFEAKRCLEIGCGGAITGKLIKEKYKVSEYIGIEYVDEASKLANKNIDKCYSGKAEDVLVNELKNEQFDFILYLDVLEHLYDPWGVFDLAATKLKKGGFIIASIPNASYFEFIYRIIFDKFEYNPSGGIMDSTHIRWFTKHTILDLFKKQKIKKIKGKTIVFNKWYSKLFYFVTLPIFRRFFTIQYLIIAKNE